MEHKRVHSPFKFLDSYQREDYHIFFGRESDADKLYDFVNKNRIVLVYGPLGSGKTSLIQCGLANKFEATDWVPFFIKRCSDINHALLHSLLQSKALGGSIDQSVLTDDHKSTRNDREPVLDAIQLINARYLRPVYLIFDQFEELLILGTDDEKALFIQTLKKILESEESASCHILFVMREEYLAWLDPIEQEIPGITDRKMRVEVMRSKDVSEVIKKSCAAFDITLESPEENAREIISIVSGKNGISLPYLQVYLDQLYRVDYKRTHATEYDGSERKNIVFTTEEIKSFGKIEEVLKLFLNDRKSAIRKDLSATFPDLPPDTLNKFIDSFVSNEGTKRPVSYTRHNLVSVGDSKKMVIPGSKSPEYLISLSPEVFTFCTEALEKNRILRDDGINYELAHDTLALVIDNQRTDKQRRLNDIRFQIQNSFKEFSKTKEYLTVRQIRAYEDSLNELNLDSEYQKFFQKSKQRRENEEYMKKKAKGKARRLKIFLWILVPVLLVMLYIGTYLLGIADRNYALKYLAYDMRDSVPPDKIPLLAGNIYQYIIPRRDRENDRAEKRNSFWIIQRIDDYLNPGGGYRKTLQNKLLEIFHQAGVQSMLSDTSFTIPSTSFKTYDFDLSSNGDYIALNYDSSGASPGRYAVINRKLNRIDTFENISYAYFTSNPDTLLLAAYPYTVSSHTFGSSQDRQNFPTRIILYDCKNGLIVHSEELGKNRWLYPKNIVFDTRTAQDSYRIRFTRSGNTIIPLMEAMSGLTPNGILQFAGNGEKKEVRLDLSVSMPASGDRVMAGRYDKLVPVIEVYDENGILKKRMNEIYFSDFTENGSLVFIRKGSIFFTNEKEETTDPIFIDSALNNVFADSVIVLGVAKNKGLVYLTDLGTRTTQSFVGTLQGFDFKNRDFLLQNGNARKNPNNSDTLLRRNFSGKVIGSCIINEGIQRIKYNRETGKTLVFTKTNQLYLIDQSMKIYAGFQLTANDLFGFSNDGKYIYYIRDNLVSVFDTNKELVNFLQFESTYKWIKTLLAKNKISPIEERAETNIRFPKEIIWSFIF